MQKQIKGENLKKLKDKQELKCIKQDKSAAKTVLITNNIVLSGGAWVCANEVNSKVEKLKSEGKSNSALVSAVWSQILYYKQVVKARGRKELFQKSSKKVSYGLDKLVQNLKEIITSIGPTDSAETAAVSAGLEYFEIPVVKDNVAASKNVHAAKLDKDRLKRKVANQKIELKKYLEDPKALVGKHIQHLCSEERGSEAQWVPAIVTDCVLCDENINATYTIEYEGSEGERQFALLKDMKKGNLLIESE